MGLGELLSLASAVSWAIAVIMFRGISHSLPAFNVNLFKNLIGFALLLPTAAVLYSGNWPSMEQHAFWITMASGFVGIALADTLYLRTLHLIGAANTAIIGSLYSPFVIIGSIAFLGEWLNGSELAGIALVMAGVLTATLKAEHLYDPKALKTGLAAGVLAMAFNAAGIIMVKPILTDQPFVYVVSLRLLAGSIGLLPLLYFSGGSKNVIKAFREFREWKRLTIASILGTYVSMMLWLGGYRYTTASIASILNETSTIFIIILAWVFLKEPLSKRKILGSLLSIAGVFIIIAV